MSAGLNFRFILVCAGVWLYSVDVLVTATIAPSMVAEIGGIPYINWTLSLYEVGAIIAGAAAAAAKVASFWVFAGFIPVLAVSLLSARVFTRRVR